MKIRGWHIEGFGVFAEREDEQLSPGMNVFIGKNEAGKSTLLAFIRTMLFGFTKSRKEQRYPPLRGGRHGGRIFIDSGDGEYTIERFFSKKVQLSVTLPDGTRAGEEEAERITAGADNQLFRNVFAISLADLRPFEDADQKEIRDRIFSAGVSGAGRSAQAVLAQLEAKKGELFKPRGACKISELVAELEEVDGRLERAREEVKQVPALLSVEDERKNKAAVLREEAALLAAEIKRLELVAETKVWTAKVHAAKEKMAALGDTVLLRPEIERERQELLILQRNGREELASIATEAEALRKKTDSVREASGAFTEESAAAIEEVYRFLEVERERKREIAGLRAEYEDDARAALLALVAGAGALLIAVALLMLMNVSLVLALFAGAVCGASVFYFLKSRSRVEKDSRVLSVEAKERKSSEWRAAAERAVQQIPGALERSAGGLEERVADCFHKIEVWRNSGVLLSQLEAQLLSLSGKLELVSAKDEGAKRALISLFAEAGAESDAELLSVLERSRQQEKCRDEIARAEEGLRERLQGAPGDGREAILNLASTMGTAELQNRISSAAAKRAELEVEIEREILELGKVIQRKEGLLRSSSIPELEGELEQLRAELAEAVSLLRKYGTAARLIEEALLRFCSERQPQVLLEASALLEKVTSRYTRVVPGDDNCTVEVMDESGRRKTTEQLSRGAQEQLYLCLRLGLAREFARHTASLPLVMDDVFVNFDPERTRAMLAVLFDLAREHQVLLFTCHPSLLELAQELAAQNGQLINVIDLDAPARDLPLSESADVETRVVAQGS